MGIFSGPYASLAVAEARSQRYDDDRIVSRLVETRLASLQWEGMLHPLHQQLAAALLAGALRGGSAEKPLRVCDFGGGLGAAYTILDAILGPSIELEWDVVETPAMARAGSAQFAQKGLRFYESIDALGDREHDVIIVSGVFQYLPEPMENLCAACLPASSPYGREPLSDPRGQRRGLGGCVPRSGYDAHRKRHVCASLGLLSTTLANRFWHHP
ncbi:methyltransferase, TIGR04325 family [Azospirillum doebereinerae]|uniref:Methyltransferase, TIGR04325 family n=1 Tax=Azospirillum doebereinerae TaxID=92933 RepID=A0A3S0XA59_9PROT|nr:methyltransferase, TIGR04325 family [Azospirillum doebereinerae]MCG5238885.1 methyltransferase, TIGR04325 family [Azospirillum doebereinerae]RUQ68898.1 methyltransferase, TIGR04325 family [Azospirillum doebereinerae]